MTRSVLVLGASSGIGRATAHLLAEQGARLVLASRGKRALEDTAEECRARGAMAVEVVPLDVRDRAAVEDVVAAWQPDAVVHACGVVSYGRFEELPPDVFDAVLATNVTGAANTARAAVRLFRERKHGTLVLVGSVLGNIGAPSMTPYIVSKYAVRALGRQLSLENRDLPGVKVCVVSPGGVDTPIYQQAANYQGKPGRPPAPVDSPQTVARAIVRALDRPRERISVGKLNPLMRLGFSLLPQVFDVVVGPLFDVIAKKPGRQEPTTGNVHEPCDELEAVSGGQGQGVGDALARLRGR